MERLDHEENFVGPHIFRDEHSTIESLSEKQQDNRERLVSLCQDKGLTLINTWFCKEPSKLVTYRNVTTQNFEAPYTTAKFGQLDFILVNQRWKKHFL